MNGLTPLRKNKEFRYVYRKGKKLNAGLMALIYIPGGNCVRQGYSISKKVGNSVTRNRTRRRMKEALRLMAGDVKNAMVVFIARPAAGSACYDDLRNCMIDLLGRAGLLKDKAEL